MDALRASSRGEAKLMKEAARRDGVLDYALANQYVRIIESQGGFCVVEYKGKRCITHRENIECR
jgi:hypothetical protein